MDWWTGFFDDTYAQIGLEQTSPAAQAKIERTVDLIVGKLGLAAGATIFDQCCGIGRLGLPLARRGFSVIGVEQAASYVELARARAAGLPCEFHAGDAFTFVAPRPCDGAINWFTSFGYHRDDRVNAKMLERGFESLRPGGKYALEIISAPKLLAEFKSSMVERIARPGGELMLIQEPSIDFAAGMILGRWTMIHPDGRREVREIENRLYLPRELVEMFERVGFRDIELCGADGEPFERTSRRLIVIGTRP